MQNGANGQPLPVVVGLKTLDIEDLMATLTEQRDALLKEYRKLCRFDGIDLTFSADAIRAIAIQVHKLGTGARQKRVMSCLRVD